MDGLPGPNAPWRISQLCNRHLHRHQIADTLHSLRHRYATQAWRGSHDLLLVKALLGHASVASTEGYALYDNTAAAAVVGAIPAPARLRVAQ